MDCIHCGGVNTASKQQTSFSTGQGAVSRMICLGCKKATKWLPHVERGEQADAAWIAGELEPMKEDT